MEPVRIPWRKIWTEKPPPNRWLAAGLPTLGIFGIGFLLRLAFDSGGGTTGLVWLGYGAPALVGLVLTVVGVAKARGSGSGGASKAGRAQVQVHARPLTTVINPK